MVNRKYQKDYGIATPLTFDGDHVALDIPNDGVETNNGWRIVPLHMAKVRILNQLPFILCSELQARELSNSVVNLGSQFGRLERYSS